MVNTGTGFWREIDILFYIQATHAIYILIWEVDMRAYGYAFTASQKRIMQYTDI